MRNKLCPLFDQSEDSSQDRHYSGPETYLLSALLERAIRDLDLDGEPLVRNYAIQWFKPGRGDTDTCIKPTILFTFNDVKSYLRLSSKRLKFIYGRVAESEEARDNNLRRDILSDVLADPGFLLRKYHSSTRRQ